MRPFWPRFIRRPPKGEPLNLHCRPSDDRRKAARVLKERQQQTLDDGTPLAGEATVLTEHSLRVPDSDITGYGPRSTCGNDGRHGRGKFSDAKWDMKSMCQCFGDKPKGWRCQHSKMEARLANEPVTKATVNK